MGVVSNAVLKGGGKVTGVIPYAIFAAGGEGKQNNKCETHVALNGASREGVSVPDPTVKLLMKNICRRLRRQVNSCHIP